MQQKKVTTELEKFTSDALGYLKWESLSTTCEVVDMSHLAFYRAQPRR